MAKIPFFQMDAFTSRPLAGNAAAVCLLDQVRISPPRPEFDEDPVTGSAHCCLGPFWSERLGKTELTAFQASSRGGVVTMKIGGDRVVLGGQAVTVLEGCFPDT